MLKELESVKSVSNDILELIKGFLGNPKSEHRAPQFQFNCPKCAERDGVICDNKYNLEVNLYKLKFNCWKCQGIDPNKGDLIWLFRKFASKKETEELKLLLPSYTIDYEAEIYDDIIYPEEVQNITKNSKAYKYLRKRGINDKLIKEFNIKVIYKGEYKGRIIIPSYEKENKINYFVTRTYYDKDYIIKYKNPKADKKSIIFNEYKLATDCDINIVEGVFDHIVMPNSIPLLGKVLSDYQLEYLYNNAEAEINIILDPDAYKNAIKIYKQLNVGKLLGRINLVKPKLDLDPAKMYELLGSKGISLLLKSRFKPKEFDIDFF